MLETRRQHDKALKCQQEKVDPLYFFEKSRGVGDLPDDQVGKDFESGVHRVARCLFEKDSRPARGIVREFLKTRGMGLDEFRRLRKGHPDKIALAAELRQSTTMTMAWIAEELNAGVPQTLWRALWKNGKSDNTRD
jgi:hypothetical protein